MAYSYVLYTGNGTTTNFTFPFAYLNADDIKVRVNGVLKSTQRNRKRLLRGAPHKAARRYEPAPARAMTLFDKVSVFGGILSRLVFEVFGANYCQQIRAAAIALDLR